MKKSIVVFQILLMVSGCSVSPPEVTAPACTESNPTVVKRSLQSLTLPQVASVIGVWSFENNTEDGAGTLDGIATQVDFTVNGCSNSDLYSAYFDSNSDRFEIPYSASIHAMQRVSVIAWVKWDGTGTGYQRIIERSKNSGGGTPLFNLMVNATTGQIMAEINTGTNVEFFSAATLPPDEWTLVGSTFDGSELKVYKNGTFVDSTPVAGNLVAADDNRSIGVGNQMERDRGFKGKISELGLWSEALSASEIQTIYDQSRQSE
jgi:hypothetical protein